MLFHIHDVFSSYGKHRLECCLLPFSKKKPLQIN